jgi:hypothetical protein
MSQLVDRIAQFRKMATDDPDNAEEETAKPTRRRMGGGANKSKKQRPAVARKTRVSRK